MSKIPTAAPRGPEAAQRAAALDAATAHTADVTASQPPDGRGTGALARAAAAELEMQAFAAAAGFENEIEAAA